MQSRRAGNTTGAIGTANGDVTPEGLVTLQPSSGASNQIGSPSPSDVLTSFPDLPPSTIPEQVPVFTPTYSPESLQGGEGFGGGSGSSSPMPTTSTSSIGGGDVNGGGSPLVPTIVGGDSDGAEGSGAGQSGSGSTGALSPSPTSKDHNGSTLSPAVTGEYSQVPTALDGSGGGGDEDTKIPTLAPRGEAGSSMGTTSSPSSGSLPPVDIGDETTSAPINAPTTEQIFEESGLSDGIAPSALPSTSIQVLSSESGHPSEEPHASLLPTLASDNSVSISLPSVEPSDQPDDTTDSFPSSLPNASPIEPGVTNGPSSFAPSTASSNSPLPTVERSESPTDNPTEGPSKKPTEQPTQQPSPRPTRVRLICVCNSFCSCFVKRNLLCDEPLLTNCLFSSIYLS